MSAAPRTPPNACPETLRFAAELAETEAKNRRAKEDKTAERASGEDEPERTDSFVEAELHGAAANALEKFARALRRAARSERRRGGR